MIDPGFDIFNHIRVTLTPNSVYPNYTYLNISSFKSNLSVSINFYKKIFFVYNKNDIIDSKFARLDLYVKI